MKKRNILWKTVKRVGAVALCTILFLGGNAGTVQADAIWEPMDDFYRDNAAECDYIGADYLTNGKEGYITLYKEPGSKEAVAQIENGKRFYVGFSWTDQDDTMWAVLSLWGYEPEEGEWVKGELENAWLPMEELAEIYNEADFRRDYEASFEEYADEMKGYEIKEAIQLWEYPGSEVSNGWIESYMQEEDEPVYRYLYTDPNGRRWTYIGYYYSHRGWVCIDEPESKVIEKSYEPESTKQALCPVVNPADDIGAEEEVLQGNDTGTDIMKLAVLPIVVLVAVTSLLINALFGKKKSNQNKGEE